LPAITVNKKYLVVIAGPTAVGKTALAVQLAKHYGSVILSADSRQFYREMNIGTAKPSAEDLAEVKHFFIDTKNVDELYGAGHYAKDASELLGTLFEENDIVFMVGGSGLYINAVINGVDDFDEIPQHVREKLNKDNEEKGLDFLRNELKRLDPHYYETVDKNNPQRIIRALEICIYTGKAYSEFLNRKKEERNFTPICILLNTERSKLYERINERVDKMMGAGLLEEVKKLRDKKHFNALKTVGYSELNDYLDGKCSLDHAVDKIKQHTRNYAKRQLTWFKHQGEFEEFEPGDLEKIKAYIDIIISHG
jgi:tRNA dimethylallyltransferase